MVGNVEKGLGFWLRVGFGVSVRVQDRRKPSLRLEKRGAGTQS